MTDTQSTDQKNDTGYVPGDDLFTRCRNYFVGITGGMTEEGIKQYRIDRDIRNEDKDCRRCEEQRDYILQYSPTVTFLNDSIRQLGGRNISRNNIHCRRCVTVRGGGFDPTFGMLICANNIKDPSVVEDTIAHEMVHAYDHLRFKADFENNLRHAACTEIRASSLSGECRWAREFFARKQWKLTQQHQECVRRRAVCSLIARPACKDEAHAERVVNEVWDSCFRDTRPFDEIFR